jgi:hypothetical protein
MGLASYVPGELIPLPLSGSIPELPPCCKSRLRLTAKRDSVVLTRVSAKSIHDGPSEEYQGQLFYEFHLGDAVPEDHLVRKIDTALDLSWLRSELAPHYSSIGRPSIDPELMIRMLVVGYVFAIRSERLICREVQVNLAYRWFCKLGIEDDIPDHF